MQGRVLWFRKSFGFIRATETEDEIYFNWESILSNDSYKQLFSGDFVEFDVSESRDRKGEDKTKAVNVRKLERISQLGKPLLRVAWIKGGNNTNLLTISNYITSKGCCGVKYVSVFKGKMIGTDIPLNKDELMSLNEILKVHQLTSKVFYTGDTFKYDLTLV